jgi:hypothetical protein
MSSNGQDDAPDDQTTDQPTRRKRKLGKWRIAGRIWIVLSIPASIGLAILCLVIGSAFSSAGTGTQAQTQAPLGPQNCSSVGFVKASDGSTDSGRSIGYTENNGNIAFAGDFENSSSNQQEHIGAYYNKATDSLWIFDSTNNTSTQASAFDLMCPDPIGHKTGPSGSTPTVNPTATNTPAATPTTPTPSLTNGPLPTGCKISFKSGGNTYNSVGTLTWIAAQNTIKGDFHTDGYGGFLVKDVYITLPQGSTFGDLPSTAPTGVTGQWHDGAGGQATDTAGTWNLTGR